MDANIVLGSAVLVLALASGVFLASIVLAAREESEQRARRPLYGPRTDNVVPRGTGEPAVSRAHCYYDCMSGFHWGSDWGGLCSEACSVSGRRPRG